MKLHPNKSDTLEAMNKFLETYKLTILNQEETDNLNRMTNSSEIKFVINKNNFPTNTSPGSDAFTEGFYRRYKISTNTYPFQNTPKTRRGWNILKLIVLGHQYPDMKTKALQINKTAGQYL